MSRPDVVARCTRHGGTKTRLFAIWGKMKRRCSNPNDKSYPFYGGRGIRVCERWNNFALFREDMGEGGPSLTLDRINPDGNYEPGNVRWATMAEQNRNRRSNRVLTLDGRTQCLAAWAEEYGMRQQTLGKRLDSGLSLREALTATTAELRRRA